MIEISDLQFSYGPKTVLKNISLKASEGNIYGLLGENGVGKTTLLTLLCGLKKPQQGSITVDGRNPFDREPSLLSDQFYLADEVTPVHAKAMSFAKEHGVFWPGFDLDKFFTILSELEVSADQRMDAMSAGQLKKTWIAFALACNAKYYYMDEPTNGLDIPSKSTFRKLMASAADDSRLVLISTHQVRDLHSLIDMVAILDNGHMLLNASTYEITQKLLFDVDDSRTTEGTVFYTEETPRGNYQVKENVNGLDSNLDLELLFNAAMMKKNEIANLFK